MRQGRPYRGTPPAGRCREPLTTNIQAYVRMFGRGRYNALDIVVFDE
jgi:hypothetical protein